MVQLTACASGPCSSGGAQCRATSTQSRPGRARLCSVGLRSMRRVSGAFRHVGPLEYSARRCLESH
eukprot:11791646-Alexandrium_andersonii.AAC.1